MASNLSRAESGGNEQGGCAAVLVATRNGKNWYPATVRNILKIQTT